MDNEKLVKLFSEATRQNWLFVSSKGLLDLYQVWRLPITSKSPATATLDSVGAALLKQKRSLDSEESLVSSPASTELTEINERIEILKYIISVREAEQRAKEEAAEKAAKRARLLKIKHDRGLSAEEAMSDEELDTALKELN